MVSLTMMARLLEAVRPDARLVLVGDPDQLASVEAGAVLGDLARAAGRPEPALDAALAAVGLPSRRWSTASSRWSTSGASTATIAAFAQAVRAATPTLRSQCCTGAPTTRRLDAAAEIASPRCGRMSSGRVPRRRGRRGGRRRRGAWPRWSSTDCCAPTGAGRSGCAGGARRSSAGSPTAPAAAAPTSGTPGRPVLVTANDYDTGLFNGDTGVVVATADGPRVAFARGGAAHVLPAVAAG